MIDETLTLWENGAVTLPKQWRERYGTRHFIAREDSRGYLVIMPILDVEYRENADGTCGLHFASGIEMNEFAKVWKEGMDIVSMEEKTANKKKKAGRSLRSSKK